MRLSGNEYNALMKIATATKTDCWFSIETNVLNEDYIMDLEERKSLTLSEGISLLFEAISDKTNYNSCNLTKGEEITLRQLSKRLNISFPNV